MPGAFLSRVDFSVARVWSPAAVQANATDANAEVLGVAGDNKTVLLFYRNKRFFWKNWFQTGGATPPLIGGVAIAVGGLVGEQANVTWTQLGGPGASLEAAVGGRGTEADTGSGHSVSTAGWVSIGADGDAVLTVPTTSFGLLGLLTVR